MVPHDEPRCWVSRVTVIAGPLILAALLGLGSGWLYQQTALAEAEVAIARQQALGDEILRRLDRIEGKIDRLEGR